ncbi:MAG: hypothetical protein M1827_003195 [Pycnora praestabilis]|nr:MAG: hypothetical protein M1827_003195 [Pycnora praestabilis]
MRFIDWSASALILFTFSSTSSALPSIWHVSIDNGPAPSPEDGAPLSRNASRDKSLLPAQIGGIFGAYVLVLLIVGIALLVMGRRLRRSAQTSPSTLGLEMVKPAIPSSFDPSPISPQDLKTAATWPSPIKFTNNFSRPSLHKHKLSSTQGSIISFDSKVIEDDKAQRQQEMERLYAAVMEQDAAQSTVIYDAKQEQILPTPTPSPPRLRVAPPPRTLTITTRPSALKLSGPGSPIGRLTGPTSPIGRLSRTSSINSHGSKRHGIRNLQISSPLASPVRYSQYASGNDSDEEPLSPRFYTDPGPPPPAPLRSPSLDEEDEYDNSPRRYSPQRSLHSMNASQRNLPLRSHISNGSVSSASKTKTTIIERPVERDMGVRTGGIPITPYSAYMPFTPITPVTPRLVTRYERKQKQREAGRMVAFEEDKVKEEGELWDSGY